MNRKKDYKSMDKYAKTKRKYQKGWRMRSGAFKYGRRKWTESEDELVLKQEKTDRELSKDIRRSIAAIYTRRLKLLKEKGKVDDSFR